MSDMEIEQAIRDAQQYAGQDNVRKDALEIINESQKLLNEVNQALKAAGKNIDKAEKNRF